MTEPWTDLGGRPSTATPPQMIRGCGKPHCNHVDSHQCPWLDETDTHGAAIPCGCQHPKPETKAKR